MDRYDDHDAAHYRHRIWHSSLSGNLIIRRRKRILKHLVIRFGLISKEWESNFSIFIMRKILFTYFQDDRDDVSCIALFDHRRDCPDDVYFL